MEQKPKTFSKRDRINVLLEEYRSLNALLLFRLNAVDRRLPISTGVFAASIVAVLTLPPAHRLALLLPLPCVVMWLSRTTVQHAIAKEDHLRRIAQIECIVNSIAEEELMAFQSRHPNRAQRSAGRSGSNTVLAAAFSGVIMLFLCLYLFLKQPGLVPVSLYAAYVAIILVDVVAGPIRLANYRYTRSPLPLVTATFR